MKRNRIITTLLILCMSLLLAFGLTACGNKCEHTYFSDCDETCNECGEAREIAVAHNYYGDCDDECHSCGKKREVTVDHDWQDATCTEVGGCRVCGMITSEPLDHSYTATGYDDHYHYQKCVTCSEPNEESKEKHVLNEEYTCECGAEFTVKQEDGAEGSVIAMLYNAKEDIIKSFTYCNEELTRVEEYYYDENSQLIKEETYLAEGTLDSYTLYNYDENGKETKREYYLGDGTPNGTTLFEYNENGDITKKTYAIDDYESITEYAYDKNGNLMKDAYEDSDGYFYLNEYEYDESGNLVKQSYQDSTGVLEIQENEYNENGSLIKCSYDFLNSENHLIGYEKYNENGTLTETWTKYANATQLFCEYYTDGETVKRELFIDADTTETVKDFDEGGRIVKETITLPDGSQVIYEYDENENIIRKTNKDSEGNETVTDYN